MTQNSVKIIEYSDYICPFCHIGFHRLEQLKLSFPLDVDIRPFELHPETPKEGLSNEELPFDPEYFAMAIANVKRLAAEDGIVFNLPTRMPNSRLALSIAEFAKKKGKFDAFHAIVFEKYWVEGKDIGDLSVLLDFATSLGMERGEILAYIKSEEPTKVLRKYLADARKIGISGVPTFIINSTVISGAQPYAVFAKVIKASQVTPS
ncbi:MAG: thioredoxin domain-containing protein [Promethearchaeota archaeon CR_4]|nr:MAG: thioredoxin domain-containing protein [Candidatus Lokiarchaeota archaeon CR_4]